MKQSISAHAVFFLTMMVMMKVVVMVMVLLFLCFCVFFFFFFFFNFFSSPLFLFPFIIGFLVLIRPRLPRR